MTILAGVIGNPIAQSRSPRLHAHWLRRHAIDGLYVPLHVSPANLERTLDLLPELGFRGVNVTLPHKETVFHLAHTVTERAAAVGAANTLTFDANGRITADNTDGYGFVANLQQQAPDWDMERPALILGAGGAARGIVAALLDAGVPAITLSNRTTARAQSTASTFDGRISTLDWAKAPAALTDHGLLVNTTSLGMTGQPPLSFEFTAMEPGTVVADIVYAPLMTPFLTSARERGATTVDGLGMLLHQAAPGFAAWFGVMPTVDDDLRHAALA